MKKFLNDGRVVSATADQAYVVDTGITLTDRAGITQHAAASGDPVEVLLEGAVRINKTTDAVTVGQKIYWHTASKFATTSSSSAKPLGWAISAQASGDANVDVKLGGF